MHTPSHFGRTFSVSFSFRRPRLNTLLAAPFLYAMIVPLLLFDLFLELYHHIVFPILGISLVPRRAYIRIDRHRLSFLPPTLKLACAYCGYANGLLQYAVRIAGETEAYFCPSKHQSVPGFHSPPHHRDFAEYGDAEGFFRRLYRVKEPTPSASTTKAPASRTGS
ncbi:MAG: hypothetical protein D6704_09060 [Nitrospirae bacterium]|nr:MAG: hypothetical protein D6704_09060 [Nitrospirota bacterium]